MLVGINHPWHRYGWDLGPAIALGDGSLISESRWDSPLPAPLTSSSGRTLNTILDRQLDEYESNGIRAVRWFLLADGYNLGAPVLNASGRSDYTPPDVRQHAFVDDFVALLGAFRRTSLQLLPCLINQGFFFSPGAYAGRTASGEPREVRFAARRGLRRFTSFDDFMHAYYRRHPEVAYSPALIPDWNRFVKGGKAAVLRDRASRTAFFDRVLQPFLDASRADADRILAWELVSEPELIPDVPTARVVDFIVEGTDRIVDSGFTATVGFQRQASLAHLWGHEDAARRLAALTAAGCFIRQVHYYPELGQPALEPVKGSDRAMVGEFGTSFVDYTTRRARAWPAWPGEKTPSIAGRLHTLRQLNFASAFLWSGQAHDGLSRWDATVQHEVSAFS